MCAEHPRVAAESWGRPTTVRRTARTGNAQARRMSGPCRSVWRPACGRG